MQISTRTANKREKGTAIVEFALTAPLLFLLVLAVFEFGLYAFAFISIQNAARAAALRNSGGPDSAGNQAAACKIVLDGVRELPNIGVSFDSTCTASPLVVTSVLCDDSAPCSGSTLSADGEIAAGVTITYSMPPLFRIPLLGPEEITSNSQMKIRNVP